MNFPTKLTVLRIILSFIIVFLLLFPFANVGINFPIISCYGVKIESLFNIWGNICNC